MDLDFRIFINLIKEKTNLDLAVYSDKGEYIAGNVDKTSKVECVTAVHSDSVNNYTLFPIMHKVKPFIGCIKGAGEVERNYAYLISELAENLFFKEPELSREDFYRAILFGELNYSQLRKYTRKFFIPDAPSCVMIISTEADKLAEVMQHLRACSDGEMDFVVKIDDAGCAFIKFNEDEEGEYQSCTEYAEFLAQSVYEEMGLALKISIGGTVKSVYDLSSSYQQALVANRMANTYNSKGEVHSFKDYMLIKMLEDLPKYKLNEYMETLMDASAREIFDDEEMINTAEEFLENSLNVSETSRNLYLHRNTLMYRLDKIEKQTGLNLKKFSDAVTFRLITILAKLVK